MSRDFDGLTEVDKDYLRAVARNIVFFQNYRGYDDYKMAELWGGISLNRYDDYKMYGPGKGTLKFIKFANSENVDLNRLLLNDLDAPFFRKEPSIIRPYDYALKLLGTTISLEPHMSASERNSIATVYLKNLIPWLGNDVEGRGFIL